VDRDTEHLIQQVINENFKSSTIIFLATRFRVIVAMDRVMVMKYGEIVEFDTPLNLLENPKSKFSMMVAQTGDINTDYLKYLANSKKDTKSISQRSFTSLQSLQSLKTASRSSSVPSRLENLFTRESSTNDIVVVKVLDINKLI
jgi:ABC-type sugar transport system ATPase subunit